MAASRSFYPSGSGVFISFKPGEVHVEQFASHLSAALQREGIPVSLSNNRDATAKSRIEQASVSIVVLSLAYAASKRNMDELLMIIHQYRARGKICFVVFYHLDPDDAEELKGSFGDAFDQLAEKFSDRRVKKWTDALAEAGGLSGEVISPYQPEAPSVTRIVKDVSCYRSHLCLRGPREIIGTGTRMQPVERLLLGNGATDHDDEGIYGVGVCGMGGVGKSVLVKHVLSQIQGQFDGCCLIQDMNEKVINRELSYLKQNSCRKVLIALDGVDKSEHVECLLQRCSWIGCGSRIVVTTRDEELLDMVVNRKLTIGGTHEIIWQMHKVGGFDYQDARRFLISIAFDGNDPPEAYMELVNEVIAYAQGNPFALKALGRCLIGKTATAWKCTLRKLDRVANLDIQSNTERSFHLLDEDLKHMFLDIACFFEGETVDYTIVMLEACYSIDVRIGLLSLVKKSLIATDNNLICIHSLHRAMGKEIIRKESPRDAGQRRILCNHGDVRHVLTNSTGSGSIEGIYLDIYKTEKMDLPWDAFAGMYNLKFLKFHASDCSRASGDNHCEVYASQGLLYLPDELILLHWHRYPLLYLPSEFNTQNLVDIHLVHTNLIRLWQGMKGLPKLKWINLGHSESLVEMPDLSEAPELESIILVGCLSLPKLHSSIEHRKKLIVLNLKDCLNLQYLPSLVSLECLESLNLAGCQNLEEMPQMPLNLKKLYVDGKWRNYSAFFNSQIPEIFYC